jgi:hypothetical protein
MGGCDVRVRVLFLCPLAAGEMLGTPKPKESLSSLLQARRVVSHNHGRMHLRLGAPISVRDFCAGHQAPRQPGDPAKACVGRCTGGCGTTVVTLWNMRGCRP